MIFDILKGVSIGLGVAMPVGPVCLLCVNFALRHGFRIALLAGLGTAIADSLFAFVASLGVHWVHGWLEAHGTLFCLVSSAFLTFLGITALRYRSSEVAASEEEASRSRWRIFATTFFVTIANPMTILAFATLFGSMGMALSIGRASAVSLWVTMGVLVGSFAWWIIVGAIISKFRTRFSSIWLLRLQKAGGCLLLLFATLSLVRIIII